MARIDSRVETLSVTRHVMTGRKWDRALTMDGLSLEVRCEVLLPNWNVCVFLTFEYRGTEESTEGVSSFWSDSECTYEQGAGL